MKPTKTDILRYYKPALVYLRIPLGLTVLFSILIVVVRLLASRPAGTVPLCLVVDDSRRNLLVSAIDQPAQARVRVPSNINYLRAISPDGKYALYTTQLSVGIIGQKGHLQVETTATGVFTTISDNIGIFGEPIWSPDNTKLALQVRVYTDEIQYYDAMLIANADGTNSQTLPVQDFSITSIDWSPDGQYIFGWSINQNPVMIRLADLSTHYGPPHQDLHRVSVNSWSPGGHQIAYFWGKPTIHLGIYSPDTATERTADLPATVNYTAYVYWSFDAHEVVVLSSRTNLNSSYQLSIYDLAVPGNLQEIEIGQIPSISQQFWQAPDSHAWVFVQDGASALLAYYPQTATYRTLIANDVLSTYVSPDGQKLLVTHKLDNHIVVDLFRSSEDPGIRIPGNFDGMVNVDWIPDNKTVLLGVQRESAWNLDEIDTELLITRQLMDDLVVRPSIMWQQSNSIQVPIAWRTKDAGGIAAYSWGDHHLAVYDADISQPNTSLSLSQIYFSPSQKNAVLVVVEGTGSSVQIVSPGKRQPIILYRGTRSMSGNVIEKWSPDGAYLAYINFPPINTAGTIQIMGSDGTVVKTMRYYGPIRRLWWSACEPITVMSLVNYFP